MTIAESLYGAIKKTIRSMSLVSFQFGVVTSTEPLKIMLDDGIELPREVLILTDNVRDMKYTIRRRELTTENTGDSWSTSSGGGPSHTHSVPEGGTHKHKLISATEITVYKRLKVGEKVLIANMQGGTRFVVLSRAEDREKIAETEVVDATQNENFEHEIPEPFTNNI